MVLVVIEVAARADTSFRPYLVHAGIREGLPVLLPRLLKILLLLKSQVNCVVQELSNRVVVLLLGGVAVVRVRLLES